MVFRQPALTAFLLGAAQDLLVCTKDLFAAAIVGNFALSRRDPHGTPLLVVVANIVVGEAARAHTEILEPGSVGKIVLIC